MYIFSIIRNTVSMTLLCGQNKGDPGTRTYQEKFTKVVTTAAKESPQLQL